MPYIHTFWRNVYTAKCSWFTSCNWIGDISLKVSNKSWRNSFVKHAYYICHGYVILNHTIVCHPPQKRWTHFWLFWIMVRLYEYTINLTMVICLRIKCQINKKIGTIVVWHGFKHVGLHKCVGHNKHVRAPCWNIFSYTYKNPYKISEWKLSFTFSYLMRN